MRALGEEIKDHLYMRRFDDIPGYSRSTLECGSIIIKSPLPTRLAEASLHLRLTVLSMNRLIVFRMVIASAGETIDIVDSDVNERECQNNLNTIPLFVQKLLQNLALSVTSVLQLDAEERASVGLEIIELGQVECKNSFRVHLTMRRNASEALVSYLASGDNHIHSLAHNKHFSFALLPKQNSVQSTTHGSRGSGNIAVDHNSIHVGVEVLSVGTGVLVLVFVVVIIVLAVCYYYRYRRANGACRSVVQKIMLCKCSAAKQLSNFHVFIVGAKKNKVQIISVVGGARTGSKIRLPGNVDIAKSSPTRGTINQFTEKSDFKAQNDLSPKRQSTSRAFNYRSPEQFALYGTRTPPVQSQTQKDTVRPRAIKLSVPEDSDDMRSIWRQSRRRRRLARRKHHPKTARKQQREVVIEMSSPEHSSASNPSTPVPTRNGSRVRPSSPSFPRNEFI